MCVGPLVGVSSPGQALESNLGNEWVISEGKITIIYVTIIGGFRNCNASSICFDMINIVNLPKKHYPLTRGLGENQAHLR